jgi:hypothetical protein
MNSSGLFCGVLTKNWWEILLMGVCGFGLCVYRLVKCCSSLFLLIVG